jgi:hypothetical protein
MMDYTCCKCGEGTNYVRPDIGYPYCESCLKAEFPEGCNVCGDTIDIVDQDPLLVDVHNDHDAPVLGWCDDCYQNCLDDI